MKRLNSWFAFSQALIALFFLVNTTTAQAQVPGVVRCYTTEMDSVRHANDPTLQTNEEFEAWLQKLITQKEKFAQSGLIIDGVYQIPVVVHVIHDGDPVGTGDNLSQAVIQSQIDVLNEDFRKLFGTNGWNTHIAGADTKIEFCLARRRPDGSAFPGGEDGINRIDRSTPGWTAPPYGTAYIDGTIKPWCTGTQFGGWDPADYMNFWVCDISGGILGYAQFPTTSLGGMGCGAQSTTTDGVVMTTSSIGKSAVTGFPGPYNEGRTATHEIGHWLGLRHIWGDGGCGVDDYCADTPLSDASNFGCPTTNSCTDNYSSPPWPSTDPNDMVENYMDYSDDLCMNIFTYDQMTRMRTVLENSPIRASLITSDACIPPATDDASIVNIIAPKGDNCVGSIIPEVTIRNRGSNNLTSATIAYTIDGGTPTTFAWTGNIASGAEANVTLPAFTALLGVHTIKAYSELPNGFVDPDPTYDTTELQFAVSNGFQPNYLEDFEGGTFVPDVRWWKDNPNGDCMEWVGQSCTSNTGTYPNDAGCVPFYQNTGAAQEEYLYTPIFILPCNASSASLEFDKAYRRRTNGSSDRLRVEISTDCGATWNPTTFDQQGAALATGGNSNSYWIPGAAGDWSHEAVDLTGLVTGASQSLMFRFRATNTGNQGGNVYVDNVEFLAVTPGEIEVDVTGVDVLDGGFYDFGSQPIGTPVTVTFTITNPGTSDLILTPPISITGDAEFALNSTFGTTTVPAGGSTTFSIDFTASGAGPFSAVVQFATNDCDEGTYDFTINGSGNVSPPVAAFTANPTTICEGSTVTYTDASTGATSWTWTFPGGSPASATGAGPHTVTYATAGTYDAQLDVTNAYGADTDLQSSLITVLPGGGAALPISEGFVNVTFPPTNWSITNNGNAITWVRDGANGTAPTAGNSAVIDNYNTNTSGDEDDLNVEPADFTGLTSAQLTFDVAYARYDGTYNDQLDVLVSDDCGQTWTVVYSKASSVLATDPDQTGAYTSPATWRNEVVDLSAYVGSSKVEVIFRNISGWGQFLYIDNINITGVVAAATADFTAAPDPACVGETVTFTDASTNATSWSWDFGAGASPATATGAGPHTVTYATDGVKNVSLSINGGADVSNQTLTVNPLDDASFSYGSAAYCASDANPTPTVTGVTPGTFSSTAGLTINPTTGEIDLASSTPGAYTVTYTTAGTCPNSSNVSVTVNADPAAPVVTASGATTFCSGGSVDLTSSQATGNVWSTTETTQTITVNSSGSYTVTYTDGNGCSAISAPTVVTVNANPATPTISAGGATTFCAGGSVDLTSSQATGNVWSTTETTQTITVNSSGSYTVTYTDGNGCSATSAPTVVTVNANPATPTISASGATTFCAGGSVDLTSSQATNNVWSTTETTQTITVNSSGSYTVTYTDGNGCSSTSAPTVVTVNANPAAPTITASGATTFCAGGSVDLTSSEPIGNMWSTGSTSSTITVNSSGSYTVTYTDGNGCSATSAPINVTVVPAPTISLGAITDPSACATPTGSIEVTGSGTGTVYWSGTTSGNSGVVTLPYTIPNLFSGPYSITFVDGTGCTSNVLNTSLTDPAGPPAPTITASGATTFCDGGSVDLTSSYATGNVWSTTETTQTITVTTSGTYTVTYVDGGGCSSTSAPITVTVNPIPAAPIISTPGPTTFCAGSSVDLTSSYGSGNLWSTGATTQTITATTSGSYTVTYTDGNGCSSTSAPTVVTVNPLPTAPVITTSGATTFCDGGSVDLTSDYGSGNQWSTAETTQTITVTSSGSYTVTYTDGNGCSATSAPTVVTVNPLPTPPTISASGPTTFCDGGSVDLTSDYGAGNTWSTAETTQTITVTTSGSYTVTYVDGNGCSAVSAATNVTVNPNPVIASGTLTDPSVCGTNTGSIEVTGTGVGDVSWTGAAVGSATSVTLPYTIGSLGAGSYDITFVNTNGCTSNTINASINDPSAPAAPVITASGATTFCDGGSVDLTSDYATGNLWSTTETTQTITVTTSGTYTVTYTDGSGCSSVSSPMIITVNPNPTAPVITASGATTFCDGGSVDLTSDYATGNLWSTAETTQTITATTSGSYTVTYTDGNGCSATSATEVVTVNPLPTVTLSAFADACLQDAAYTLTGGSPAGGTYSGAGVTGSTFDPASAGVGVHTITYTYTDGNGCTGTAQSDLRVDDCSAIIELADGAISVYPNPTFSGVNINGNELQLESVKVFDGAGRLVLERSIAANQIKIDLADYAPGVYSLEVKTSEDKVFRTRVLKQ